MVALINMARLCLIYIIYNVASFIGNHSFMNPFKLFWEVIDVRSLLGRMAWI